MKTNLIIIGTEILNGKTADKNIHYFAKLVNQNGFSLTNVQIIPDELALLEKEFKNSFKNYDITITSGGMGPTKDDMTKMALQNCFSKKIIKSTLANSITKKNYQRYGLNLKDSETKNFYPYVPQDFTPHNNPKGLAPGLSYQKDGHIFLCAPGVPKEFRGMLKEEYIPIILENFKDQISPQKRVTIRTKLIPEEKIFSTVCPNLWDTLQEYGSVSSLPHLAGVDISITLSKKYAENCEQTKKKISKQIYKTPLKDNIWQIGELSLEEIIVQEASTLKLQIGSAESCTGGLIASRITNVSGSSNCFKGSVVSYSNEVKNKTLNVNNETLKQHGAVSIETAKEMASGVREALDLDYAVSTTGIAGPLGDTSNKKVGMVCIGISSKEKTYAKQFNFNGDRIALKKRFSEVALYLLLKEIRQASV